MRRAPHTENPIETRQAFQRISDDLDAVESSSGDSVAVGAEAVVAGQPLYHPAGAATVGVARADDADKSRVCGLAKKAYSSGANVTFVTSGNLTLADWTDVLGSASLTSATVYYLDSTGGITATAPSTPGEYVTEIGQAASTTTLQIRIRRPILL